MAGDFQHFPDNFPALRECGFLFTSLWLPFHLPLEGGGRPRRGREGVTALRPLPILPHTQRKAERGTPHPGLPSAVRPSPFRGGKQTLPCLLNAGGARPLPRPAGYTADKVSRRELLLA